MNITIKQIDDFKESVLSLLIILLGLAMVAALAYYIFLPFSDMIADQLQSQNSKIYYSSI